MCALRYFCWETSTCPHSVRKLLLPPVYLLQSPCSSGGCPYLQDPLYSVGTDISVSRKLGGPFAEDVAVTPSCFGTLQVRSSSFLLTCGHWDNSFKVISLSDGRMVQSNCQHKDIVTCLSGILSLKLLQFSTKIIFCDMTLSLVMRCMWRFSLLIFPIS